MILSMGIIRNTPFITALLLVCIAISFSSNARSRCGGILIEDYDYASMISLKSPDIPTCIINILPRIIIEGADFELKIDLETPLGISKIIDFALTKVTIEYAEYVFTRNIGSKPALIDRSPPRIQSVYQRPPWDEVYPTDKVEVYAIIYDDLSDVKRAILNYTLGYGEWAVKELMRKDKDIFHTTIPKLPSTTEVKYIIITEDYAGNIAMSNEYTYTVLPIIVKAYPQNFTIASGETLFITLSLTDIFSRPISNRTITWILRGEAFTKTGKIITNENGTAILACAIEEVPFETFVSIHLLFNEMESTTISAGKILIGTTNFLPTITFYANTLIFIISICCVVKKVRSWKKVQNWWISRKVKVILTLVVFLLSLLTFWPLGFSSAFTQVLFRAPKPFALGIMFLLIAHVLFSLAGGSLVWGLLLGLSYLLGLIFGLALPSFERVREFILLLEKPGTITQTIMLLCIPLFSSILGKELWPPFIISKTASGAKIVAVEKRGRISVFLKNDDVITLKCKRERVPDLVRRMNLGVITIVDLLNDVKEVKCNKLKLDLSREIAGAICFSLNRYPQFKHPNLGSKGNIRRYIDYLADSILISDGTNTLGFYFKQEPNLIKFSEELEKGTVSKDFLNSLKEIRVNSISLTPNKYRISKSLKIWQSFTLNKEELLDLQYEYPREMPEEEIVKRLLTDWNALDLFVKDYELAFRNNDIDFQNKLVYVLENVKKKLEEYDRMRCRKA